LILAPVSNPGRLRTILQSTFKKTGMKELSEEGCRHMGLQTRGAIGQTRTIISEGKDYECE